MFKAIIKINKDNIIKFKVQIQSLGKLCNKINCQQIFKIIKENKEIIKNNKKRNSKLVKNKNNYSQKLLNSKKCKNNRS